MPTAVHDRQEVPGLRHITRDGREAKMESLHRIIGHAYIPTMVLDLKHKPKDTSQTII
jgi:hypothetical protein